MIYADTSVLLAQLFAEDRRPPSNFWSHELLTSRLTAFELWTRIHAKKLSSTHGEAARSLLDRLTHLELTPPVLERALEPFPIPVRTLDALHLASFHFVQQRLPSLSLATYDKRMAEAATSMGFKIFPL